MRNLLNTLPGDWIGRGGTIEGAPKSSDLTPMGFFLWGAMKDPIVWMILKWLSRCSLMLLTQTRSYAPESVNPFFPI